MQKTWLSPFFKNLDIHSYALLATRRGPRTSSRTTDASLEYVLVRDILFSLMPKFGSQPPLDPSRQVRHTHINSYTQDNTHAIISSFSTFRHFALFYFHATPPSAYILHEWRANCHYHINDGLKLWNGGRNHQWLRAPNYVVKPQTKSILGVIAMLQKIS